MEDYKVSAYIIYILCRQLLIDMKSIVDDINEEYEGSQWHYQWSQFYRTAKEHRNMHYFLELTITSKNIIKETRQIGIFDISSAISFFDEMYSNDFNDPMILTKIEKFFENEEYGLGKLLKEKYTTKYMNLMKLIHTRKQTEFVHPFCDTNLDKYTVDYFDNYKNTLMCSKVESLPYIYGQMISQTWLFIESAMNISMDVLYNVHTTKIREYLEKVKNVKKEDMNLEGGFYSILLQINDIYSEYKRKCLMRRLRIINWRKNKRKSDGFRGQ